MQNFGVTSREYYGIFSSVEFYELQSARISGLEYLLKYKLLITSAYTFQSKKMA